MSGTLKTVVLNVNDAREDGIYYIVLPPYTGTNLTVTVYDDPQVIMTLRQNDDGGHTLPANQIASIDIGSRDLGRGIFSVSATSKVSFAKGNLTGTSSYDFESTQTASGTRYGTTSRPSISVSDNMAENWFYLSDAEWTYLLNRSDNENHSFAVRGTIDGTIKGLILLPDTWYESLLPIASTQTQFNNQTPNMSALTVDQWDVCEALGAVFLVADENTHNLYFTGENHYVSFGQNLGPSNPVAVTNKTNGTSYTHVRLAHFVVGSPTIANSTPTPTN